MQFLAEALNNGGGFAYLALLLGIVALPMGITAIIISLAAGRRKIGVIFGVITLGLSVLAVLAGIVGQVAGMMEARAALLGMIPPDQVTSMGAKVVSVALAPLSIALLIAGLPFVLGVLALSRAAVRPAQGEGESYLVERKAALERTGKLGAVFGAILPGFMTLLAFVVYAVQMGGPQHLAMTLEESGPWGLLLLFHAIVAAVLLSILGAKAARGRRVLVAPLVLLACLPWLVGAIATLFAGSEALAALDYAAPDMRAAFMARGIAVSLGTQTLGALISGWLLLALGLTLALGARSQRADSRLGGKGFLFGGLASIPLLALAGVTFVGGEISPLVIFAALFAVVITMLGASGLGNDGPYHRSVCLGAGAALTAGLALVAFFHGVAGVFATQGFSALAMVAPDSRASVLARAVETMRPLFMVRDYGWIVALLPAAVIGLLGIRSAQVNRGRIAGVVFAVAMFAVPPALYLMGASMLRMPDWAAPKSPWANLDFSPPVVTDVACRLGGGAPDPAVEVGMAQVYSKGLALGNLAQPGVTQQMLESFQNAFAMQAAMGSDRTRIKMDLAVDGRLPAQHLNVVLRTAQMAGAASVRLVGVEAPSAGIQVEESDVTAALHPLMAFFNASMGNTACALEVGLGDFRLEAGGLPVWKGVVTGAEEIALTPLGPGISSSPPEIRIPGTTAAALRELGYTEVDRSDSPAGYVLLTGDPSVSTGRMILAAAAVRARGLMPSFPDPTKI